jgi:glycosyltransferase involved in cell wall biosynthesis
VVLKISVVLPTNRPSGTKFALHGLAKQSFPQKDFELIIVDDYPEDREKLIRSRSELLGLWNLKVLRSKPNYWRSNRLIGNARNTALIHADGELVVFLDDYCWIRSRWLDEHWNTYKRTPFTMVGAMKAVKYEGGVYDDLDQFPPPSEGLGREGEASCLGLP